MSVDELSCTDAIEYVFGDDSLPSIRTDLRNMGGTVADGSCPDCDGVLYELEYEVVCSSCSIVIGSDTREEKQTRWDAFRADRPDYYHSSKKRCIGGFPNTYDWVEREDIDNPVKQLDPASFYK